MSLIQLSPSNGDSLLINSGPFSTGKIIRTRNELVFYTDQYGNSTGYRWLGNLPHTINGNSPQTDGGISSTSWESYITSNLYDKLKSENITLSGTAHLPTVEVAYGLPKGSLKVWTPGSTSSSSQYWLYTDGTVWGGVGTLGTIPDVPFTQIHLQRDIIKYSYSVENNGQTTVEIPYDFSSIIVYINGVLQSDIYNSYIISDRVITFGSALNMGDIIEVFLHNVPVSSINYVLQNQLSNYMLKSDLNSQNGASSVGLQQGGTLQDAINFVTPEMFGAIGDGTTDDGNAIKLAWDYITTNGGVLYFAGKTYYIGTTRIKISYSANLKPHIIKGCGQTTILKFGDIPPSGLASDANWVKEEPLIQYLGNSGTNYIPSVTIQDLTIDYSLQSNKGGTSLSTLSTTHPTPYSLGVWGIYFMYALTPSIKNVKLNEIYGDGIIIRKSTMPTVDSCYFYNVSAGNILTRYTPQNMASDSNGGCVFLWACHGGIVQNNTCWNTRVYLANVVSIDNGTQIQNTLCGYIGIWAEYGYDQNITSSGGETAPPLISTYINYNSVNVDKWNNESYGAVIKNNTVYGYTIGIKSEGFNEALICQNTVLNCYITIFAASTRSVISENWTDMLYCDNRTCPQGGFQTVRGHIVCHNYSSIIDGARTGVTISKNKCYATNYTAMRLDRIAAQVDNNMFRFARGTSSFFDINLSSLVYGTTITNNIFFIDDTISGFNTSNLQYHDHIIFSDNTFINNSSYKATLAFRNTCKDVVLRDNHFNGYFYIALQCSSTVENNTFDSWKPINSIYYTDKLFEVTDTSYIDGNTFRINSSTTTGQIVISSNYTTFINNKIDVQETGTTSASAWVYCPSGSSGLIFKNNNLLNGQNTTPLFYLFNSHYPTFDNNTTSGVLIIRGGSMYAPISIGVNKCSSLWSVQPSELNTSANISSNITPYIGLKMNYITPISGGKEGEIYTSSGWKTFGSIS